MAIGKRIKQARENSGMSREQLAAKINVTPSSISNYENDISHPKELILYNLMNVLQVDANFLFQDEIKKPATNEDDELSEDKSYIMDIIRNLDDHQAKQARIYLDLLIGKDTS